MKSKHKCVDDSYHRQGASEAKPQSGGRSLNGALYFDLHGVCYMIIIAVVVFDWLSGFLRAAGA